MKIQKRQSENYKQRETNNMRFLIYTIISIILCKLFPTFFNLTFNEVITICGVLAILAKLDRIGKMNEEIKPSIMYRHIGNNKFYWTIYEVINKSKDNKNQIMVHYIDNTGKPFVRDKKEFLEEFEKVE